MPPGRGGKWSRPGAKSTGQLKLGPTNDDLEVKAALQRMLKPAHYPIIVPWMATVEPHVLQDVIALSRALEASEAMLVEQRTAYFAATEPLTAMRGGRIRVAKAVPVSADRAQVDMVYNRHGSQQTDTALEAHRNFFRTEYAQIPSCHTVDDAHRLGSVNLMTDATTRVLTEESRRKLQRWQIRGPERDRRTTAQVMRALRSISEAVTSLPTYSDHCRSRGPAGGATARMHEYTYTVGKGHRTFKEGMVPGELRVCKSAPMLMTKLPEYISQGEIDKIAKPGGDVVNLGDAVQLQAMKNLFRAGRSKIALAGSIQDYSTTYKHGYGPPVVA